MPEVSSRSNRGGAVSDDLFERARNSASIAIVGGTKVTRSGRDMRGPCPLCRHGDDKRRSGFAYVVKVNRSGVEHFHCHSCGESGDVVDLEHLLRSKPSESKADAARRLVGEGKAAAPAVRKTVAPNYNPAAPNFMQQLAAQMWREGRPAAGTLVQTYLMSRGIYARPLREALKHLRFHPAAYYSGRGPTLKTHPAMLALPRAPAGPTGGIHCTYLARDGSGKASVGENGNAKRMIGPQVREGIYGGAWLTHPESEGPLIEGEGIETVLSKACLYGKPCRAVAALSLDRLQGVPKKDSWGRFNPGAPELDPEATVFVWPEPENAPWGEIMSCVDHDMRPLKVRVRATTGRTIERLLGPTERARLSGALIKQKWRRAGVANVSIHAPPLGMDFNNLLKEAEDA